MDDGSGEGEAAVLLGVARWHFTRAEKRLLRSIARLKVGEAGALEVLAELHRLRAEELEGAAWRLGEAIEAEAGGRHAMASKEDA